MWQNSTSIHDCKWKNSQHFSSCVGKNPVLLYCVLLPHKSPLLFTQPSLPVTKCMEVFPHHQGIHRQQQSVQEFNSILTLSNRKQHQMPQVKVSVPQDCPSTEPCPTSETSCKPRYHLCFWPTGHRLGDPRTPSLGLINLLERLTELRQAFYLLDH